MTKGHFLIVVILYSFELCKSIRIRKKNDQWSYFC